MISLNTWSKKRKKDKEGRKEEQDREEEGRRWVEGGREEGERGTVEGEEGAGGSQAGRRREDFEYNACSPRPGIPSSHWEYGLLS